MSITNAADDESLSVNEEINSVFVAENPFGVWRIELHEPVLTSLSSEAQIAEIFSNSYLGQHNEVFAEMQIGSATNGHWKRTGDDFPEFLFDDAQKFLREFVDSGYRLTNFHIQRKNSDGTTRYFSSDIFGVVEGNHLLRIWGMQRESSIDFQPERKELQEKIRAAQTEAENANRLKDEFLSTISHELRTPLTAILGWTQMLLGGKLDAEMSRHGLETIARNVNTQTQLIEDLLDVSRIINGKLKIEPQPLNLRTIVNAAVESVEPTLTVKNIEIKFELADDLPPVLADPRRIQQILWNLLTNAAKFTPRNGEIQIRSEQIESFIEISVSDTGIGIKPECLPHVFDRFRQADGKTTRRFGGLGLGLAIVRHLVEMHGSTVEADSEGENCGATFTFRLPAVDLKLKSAREATEIAASPKENKMEKSLSELQRLDGVKLLLVDDDNDNLDLLELLFDNFGAEVTTAHSAAEAIEKYPLFHPDLVISDIGMPDEDGYSLIKRIRQIAATDGGQKPAIALTAFAKKEDSRRAIAAGFQLHIKKPVEPAELVESVSELLKNWQPNEAARP